jgi:rubrerythrin
MPNSHDPKSITDFINCLSVFESAASLLYKNIADKVELPQVKSLLLEVSSDSHKHSTLLKGIGEHLPKTNWKPKDCPKKIGAAWQIVVSFSNEISAKERITEEELSKLSEKLITLESIMGEEYYMLVQLKTLQLMTKEINELYDVNLEGLQKVFTQIINEEEHHREILQTIRQLIEKKEQPETDNAPAVRYQNPDSWSQALPPTS